jgi:hypothetical protein
MPATARPTQAHSHAGGPAGAKPKLYNPRHPERTLLHQTIAEHFETWFELASAGQFDGQGDHHTPKPYVRQAFRKYLECGIFAHGFARAWCDDCGHDYFCGLFLQGPGCLPLVQHPAHGGDSGASDGPRLSPSCRCASGCCRYQSGCATSCSVTGQCWAWCCAFSCGSLRKAYLANCPSAADVNKAAQHIGAVAFIHRFGSSLNGHVHFHVCAVDGVFEEVPVTVVGAKPTSNPHHRASFFTRPVLSTRPLWLRYRPTLRRRILRAFVGRGLIEKLLMPKRCWATSTAGFRWMPGVCIEAHDRAALERLLRYCARPPFAMERLRKEGAALVYRCAKQRSEPTSDKRGAKVGRVAPHSRWS